MFNNDLSFEDNLSDYIDDELGAIPTELITAGAAMLPGLLGGVLGGGKKSQASTAPVAAAPIVQASNSSSPELLSLITSLPQVIRDQVKQVLTETQANRGTIEQANKAIAATVDAQFQPQIKTILQSLALAQTQRDVTSEHNSLVAEKAYKDNTTSSLNNLNKKIVNLQAMLSNKLSGAKIVRNKKVIDILGGNDFMDSLNR